MRQNDGLSFGGYTLSARSPLWRLAHFLRPRPQETLLAMARMLTIISGGQTGVDRAALDAALLAGVSIEGWCPCGRVAEDGVLDERYLLRETPSSRYPERTEWNVRDAEGTLLLPYGRLLGGTGLTAKLAAKHGKPTLRIDIADPADLRNAASKILAWMQEAGITRLNVAGPRASSAPEVYGITLRVIKRLIVIWGERAKLSLEKPTKHKSALPKGQKRAAKKNILRNDSMDIDTTASGGDKTALQTVREASPVVNFLWSTEEIQTIQRELPRWFARFGRELPWRETRDPYKIWVSEIMLQQTTVVAVRPFYERFLARFPNVDSLALASEEEVLRLWEGLGYYSRGRNLRTAAIIIRDVWKGRFPESLAGLREQIGRAHV